MRSEDIARLAGVSRSTVSRVINNYPNVPEKTRDKVLKVIKQYNYEPNTWARALAGKSNNTIGLFVISISKTQAPSKIYKSTYYSSFINAVVDAANTSGYYVLVHTIYCSKDYSKINQAFNQKRICGGILVGNEKNSDIIKEITKMGCPLGVVDYDPDEAMNRSNLIVVNSMDYDGTAKALNYLIELGHRDIGIITGRLGTYSGQQRFESYKQTLKEHKLKINPEFILKGEFLKDKTYNEVKKLIKSKSLPTALFACNDDMALAAMEAFREEGFNIPEDISVIGFDDIPVASQMNPALTTVRVPVYDMVTEITEMLIDGIEKGRKKFYCKNFDTVFKIRDTCMKVKE
ncbi:UNVERIFIED_CONTAM: LacI family transcriptional regulator [Acetivibrio alkalicellulosi]